MHAGATTALKKHAIVTDRARPPEGALGERATGPQPLVGAQFETAASATSNLPAADVPEVAFAGRSNAGKSSAINALARHRGLAFASRTPGRTQQINFFRLRGGGRAVDLPGYGYAAVAKSLKREWQSFLWEYVQGRSTLVGLVVVVDARHGMKAQDVDLVGAFAHSARPVLVLATKSDKLNNSERRAAVAGIAAQLQELALPVTPRVLAFSATARTGVMEADAVLAEWLPAPLRE
jgi:GTP-binding protein